MLRYSWHTAAHSCHPRSVWLYSTYRRSFVTRIQAGDQVLLQLPRKDPFLTKKLRPEGKTTLQYGDVMHADIIGKQSRETVRSTRGAEIRVYLPSLAEYVTMTPRIVTPIYPADANLIVSLLDFHPTPLRCTADQPLLEILEAGTGNGALTLHLARAIHATTLAPMVQGVPKRRELGPQSNEQRGGENAMADQAEEKESNLRQAVVHTIDVSQKRSEHAQGIVEGFRQGLYVNDINFHVGDVSGWIDQQIASRATASSDKSFLEHALLDMPNAQNHVEKLASVLRMNGNLVVFNPSTTQITAVVELIKRKYLPLQLDRVLELGPSMTGGREWDVRSVIPRAVVQSQMLAKSDPRGESEDSDADKEAGAACQSSKSRDGEEAESLTKQDAGWEMICRPKVGHRVAGGGFVGVWKKMRY